MLIGSWQFSLLGSPTFLDPTFISQIRGEHPLPGLGVGKNGEQMQIFDH